MSEIGHKYTEEVVCPWCGYEHTDSCEFANYYNDYQCPECEKYFSLEIHEYTNFKYSSKKSRESNEEIK